MKRIAICILGLMLPLAGMSQDKEIAGPNLEETKAHVASVLGGCFRRFDDSDPKSSWIHRIQEGSVKYGISDTGFEFLRKAEFRLSGNPNVMYLDERTSVHLKDLDPTPKIEQHADGRPSWIRFTCTSGRCVNLITAVSAGGKTKNSEKKSDELSLPACDASAERLSRALEHLIKLSGGKKTLF